MKAAWCIVIVLCLAACGTCRVRAIEDAENWAARGEQSRIACYYVGLEGRLAGAFIWNADCQAQVLRDGRWLWVGKFGGLKESPTYSMRQVEPGKDYYTWTVDAYKGLLSSHGKATHRTKAAKYGAYALWLLLII